MSEAWWARLRCACAVLLIVHIVAFVTSSARAQGREGSAEGVASFVGDGPSGLPGIGRVAVASPRTAHATAALGAGYGFTEAQAGESGSHHRASGTLGLAVQPLRIFSAALMLDGRYDKHPDDVLGSSSSAVGEPRVVLRAAEALGDSFALGGQLVMWVPGAEAPSLRPEATTLDANLLATYAPRASHFAMALNAGYRLDRSSHAIDAPQRLRPGDRLSLQSSAFDAILLGLAGSRRFGDVELLGEVTWDVLVGQGAPGATASPLRAGLGARYHVTDAVQIELRSQIALSERPRLGPAEPLAPVEPRAAVLVGLRFVLPFTASAAKTPDGQPSGGPTKLPEVVGSVRGRVSKETGEPIAGAHVTVTSQENGSAAGESPATPIEHEVETGADGSFAVDDVRSGRVRVVAKASEFVDMTADATVGPKASAVVNLVMKRVIRPGQLRGLVRSFNGKPLVATIRVEPLGVETTTDTDGTFQIDVPPGSYQVVVAAPGHAGQRRPMQVEENGVTVLNADMRQGP